MLGNNRCLSVYGDLMVRQSRACMQKDWHHGVDRDFRLYSVEEKLTIVYCIPMESITFYTGKCRHHQSQGLC